jgi:hypothetical protein
MKISDISFASNDNSHLPWPVLPSDDVSVKFSIRHKAIEAANTIMDKYSTLASDWFGALGVEAGILPTPTVYLEDHRPIPLISNKSASGFEYRILGLAGEYDFFVTSQPRDKDFEAYMSEYVGFGKTEVLSTFGAQKSGCTRLAKACLENEEVMYKLITSAIEYGGINLMPFISSGDVWALAAKIARHAGIIVKIAAPPPHIARLANNKVWFTALVQKLLGRKSTPLTYRTYNLADTAYRILQLSAETDKIVLKIPASAGSAGNIVVQSSEFYGKSLSAIYNWLQSHLEQIGWHKTFPLLLGDWESNVVSSPSVQLWIPHVEDGDPVVEGVFVQRVAGVTGKFIGAELVHLPGKVRKQLTREAVFIALTLQYLGYYGRLSLDSVLVGRETSRSTVHWIEANARWGGVSIPLAVKRKLGTEDRENLLIVQRSRKVAFGKDIRALQKNFDRWMVQKSMQRSRGLLFLLPPDSQHLLFLINSLPPKEARDLVQKVISFCE